MIGGGLTQVLEKLVGLRPISPTRSAAFGYPPTLLLSPPLHQIKEVCLWRASQLLDLSRFWCMHQKV